MPVAWRSQPLTARPCRPRPTRPQVSHRTQCGTTECCRGRACAHRRTSRLVIIFSVRPSQEHPLASLACAQQARGPGKPLVPFTLAVLLTRVAPQHGALHTSPPSPYLSAQSLVTCAPDPICRTHLAHSPCITAVRCALCALPVLTNQMHPTPNSPINPMKASFQHFCHFAVTDVHQQMPCCLRLDCKR